MVYHFASSKKIAAGAYHFGFIILQGQFVKKNRRGRLSFSWVIILQVHFVSFSEKSHLSFFKSFSRFGFPSDPKEAFIILQVMFSVKFWHFLSLSFCKSSLFFPVSVYHFPGSFCQNFHQPHVQKIQTQQTPFTTAVFRYHCCCYRVSPVLLFFSRCRCCFSPVRHCLETSVKSIK